MNAQQLKNAILQEAIAGRLVPQDPNDEPASVLLDKIRAEKKRLVKEGKLKKKDLEEIPISEEEIPFEIPDSWEWVRVKDIFIINPKVVADDNVDAAFIPMEKIEACYGSKFSYEIRKWKDIKSSFTCFSDGDVAFAKITPCFQNRKSMILEKLPNGVGAGTTELKVLRQYSDTMDRKYLLYFLASSYFIDEASFKGTANQQRIVVGYLENKIFPLPPLAEQHRIVAKIEELLPKVEEYGKAQKALDKLNKELPERLKKSILQEAISGRLVPQDPNDEPASVLLDKIRAEKKRLVKEGKLKKKDLEETPISEEEIPFDIPENWEWVRINTVMKVLDSQRKPVSKFDREAGVYPYCGANGILDYVKHYIFDGKYILVGEDGSVITKGGNPVVNRIEGKIWVNNHAHIIQEYAELKYQDYIYYCLQATDITKYVHGFMPKYSQSDLRDTTIPLPPLAEQKRIVAKIEELFKEVDSLQQP